MRLTDEECKQIRTLYESGYSARQIAGAIYCERSTVYNAIKKAGGKAVRKFPVDDVIKTYKSGASAKETGKKTGVSEFKVYKILRENNVKIRSRRKYPIDEIIADWNAGMSSKQIADRYGVERNHVSSRLCHWRNKGYDVKWRDER